MQIGIFEMVYLIGFALDGVQFKRIILLSAVSEVKVKPHKGKGDCYQNNSARGTLQPMDES